MIRAVGDRQGKEPEIRLDILVAAVGQSPRPRCGDPCFYPGLLSHFNFESLIFAGDERYILEFHKAERAIAEAHTLDLGHAHVFENKLMLSQTCLSVVTHIL